MQRLWGPYFYRILRNLLEREDSNIKSFLLQELQYQKLFHPKDAMVRLELSTINKPNEQNIAKNLVIIYDDCIGS